MHLRCEREWRGILRRFRLSQGGGLRPRIILLDSLTWCEPQWYVYEYVCMYTSGAALRKLHVKKMGEDLAPEVLRNSPGSPQGPHMSTVCNLLGSGLV